MKDFAALLPTLADHENITLGKTSAVTVTRTPLKLPLRATLEANGEIVLALKEKAAAIRDGWRLGLAEADAAAAGFAARRSGCVSQSPVRVPRSQVPQFLSQHWPQLQAAGGVEANFQLADFTLEPQAPRFLLALKGGLAQLGALLQCAYGPRIMTVGVTATDESVWLPDPEVPTRYSTRDFNAERAALGRLQRSGFAGPDSQGKLQLVGQNAVLNFFAREFAKLQREWSVTLDEQLENRTLKNIERVEPQFQITSSGVQWFDLGVVFAASGGETFSAADIQRLILSGQSHTRLKNGRIAVIDTGAVEELQEVLLDCAPQQNAQGYRISSKQAGFLEATLRQHGDWKVQAPAAWRDRAAKQSGEAKLECPPLGELEDGVASVPKARRGVAGLSARERLRRHSRGRNGLGQNAAGAGVPAFAANVAAGILACRRAGLPAWRNRRGKFRSIHSFRAWTGRQDAALYGRQGCLPLRAALDRLPHEPRVQLGGRGEEIYAGTQSPRAARAGPARAVR